MNVNNSEAHIKEYIEGTIERLGSAPDLYYLHRIEPGRSLDESINALSDLKKAGKCRYIGLSECSTETLRKACKGECTLSFFLSRFPVLRSFFLP
jgi:aryl-alcohol dehydrogenase-like predicted oxidoreductase